MTMAAIDFEAEPVFTHVSVMPNEVVEALDPSRGGVFVDATAGGAGHSAALLAASPDVRLIACDRDPLAVRTAQTRLAQFGARAQCVHASFDQIPERLAALGITQIDGILADLGVSSQQLADAERGMSFRASGPLDMRMDPTRGETALELRRAVVRAVGPRRLGGVDPATKTFQALRIAVNGELDQLIRLLDIAKNLLVPGGVAAFISFHSLEDRLVKRAFLDRSSWQRMHKKPVLAGETELAENPRARSAKLRAALRVEAEPPSDPSWGEEA